MDIASAAAIVNSINKLENKGKETVKVVVRCRPLFGKELVEGRQSIVTMDLEAAVVSIKCPENNQLKSFTFDSVYDEHTIQRQFYDESGYPLVESIFEGYNGTIFAYGQTGCGKTHTMQGKDSPPELRGVIPHAFDHVFDNINADTEKEYMVRATYLEIYNEDIRDLLSEDSNKQKLELKESADGGVYVKDLTEVVVSDVVSINKVMTRGFKNRTIGATLMNEGSSRSHSIFTIVVEISEKVNGEERFRAGKLNLVDLAGSERQSKTGATGARLKEGCKINLSLSALGNVISALVDGKGKHIPYRDSKLTRLLQDSLGGNTKTVMVAAISPADYNFEETLSTLRYANRAKNIKNKPTVNEDPKDAKLREYKAEIDQLKLLLAQQKSSTPPEFVARPPSDRKASPPSYSLTLEEEANEIAATEQVSSSQSSRSTPSHGLRKSPTDRERELEEKSQVLQEQIQREKDEIQRQLKLEQDAIESAKADAAAMMEMARKMMAEMQATPQIVSSIGNPQSPSNSTSPPDENTTNEVETAEIQSSKPVDEEKLREQEKKETELQELREKELIRIKEVKETKANAAEMMKQAELMMQDALARAAQPPKIEIVKEVVEVVKEVVSEDHIKQKAALEEMNQTILNHRNQMAKELEMTQMAMESHLREKSELASKLEKIGSQICGKSGTSGVDAEVAVLKQQVEFRRAQIKLKMKKKKETQYEIAKKALQAEKQSVEEELKNAQEQAQVNIAAYKKKQMKYKAKLDAAKEEIVDMRQEFEREKESLMDTIHQQSREVKLMEQLVEIFLPQNELIKVWEKAIWIEDKEEWQLPRIKPRGNFTNMKLPTIGNSNFAPIDRPFSGGETGGAEVCSNDTPMSNRSIKSRSKTRGKFDGISSRGEDNGMDLLPLNDINRSTKLPSASKSSRKDKKDEDELTQKNSASKKKEKKKKEKNRDEIQNNSLSNSLEPLIQMEFPILPTDDMLYPLETDYQPRDRLQSRQGSRQGHRTIETKLNGLGDTEDKPKRRRKSHTKEINDEIKDENELKKKKKKKECIKIKTPSSTTTDLSNSTNIISPEDPDYDDLYEDFS